MKRIKLNIDYFEFGYLYASIREDSWDKMPRSLWLKLKIISLEAYVKHPSFNKKSADLLKFWHQELEELKGGKNGKKSK